MRLKASLSQPKGEGEAMSIFDDLLDLAVDVTSTVVAEVVASPITIVTKGVELAEKTVDKIEKEVEDKLP